MSRTAAAAAGGASSNLFLTDSLFTQAGLDSRVWKCLSSLRLARMSRVQAAAIPVLLGGANAIVKAKTGSGKTLAYAVPIVQQILLEQEANPDSARQLTHLILLPTLELCEQVRVTVSSLLKFCSDCVRVVALRGGEGDSAATRTANEAAIRESAPNILMATPVQLLNYCKSCESKASTRPYLQGLQRSLKHLVLDEADLLLGLGYESDLSALLSSRYLGHGFQISLFSATVDTAVEELRNVYLGAQAQVVAVEEPEQAGALGGAKLSQFFVRCGARDKYLLTYAFLQLGILDLSKRILFFVHSVEDAYRLRIFLGHFSVRAAVLNHELPANSRQNILEQFNRGVIDLLIATEKSAGEGEEEEQREKKGKKRAKEEEEEDAVKEEDAEEEDEAAAPAAKAPAAKKAKHAAAGAASSSAAAAATSAPLSQLDEDLAALAALDKPSNGASAAGRTSRRYRGHNHWGRGESSNVSRGVDFKDVGTVVLFDFPRSVKSYIHRIGRTARADRSGVSLAFVTQGDKADEASLQAVLDTQTEGAIRAGLPAEHALPALQPLPFSPDAVEAFRYRVSDKMRAVTALSIREERLAQIKTELVNSARLAAHWEDNPRELHLLQHDKVLRTAKIQKHLATVPRYLLPEGMDEGALAASSGAAPAASGAGDANRNKLRRNKHKAGIKTGNARAKLDTKGLSGIALAKAKGRFTMAQKNATDPLRSFRAKSLTGAGGFSSAAGGAAASGAGSKAKVDF